MPTHNEYGKEIDVYSCKYCPTIAWIEVEQAEKMEVIICKSCKGILNFVTGEHKARIFKESTVEELMSAILGLMKHAKDNFWKSFYLVPKGFKKGDYMIRISSGVLDVKKTTWNMSYFNELVTIEIGTKITEESVKEAIYKSMR